MSSTWTFGAPRTIVLLGIRPVTFTWYMSIQSPCYNVTFIRILLMNKTFMDTFEFVDKAHTGNVFVLNIHFDIQVLQRKFLIYFRLHEIGRKKKRRKNVNFEQYDISPQLLWLSAPKRTHPQQIWRIFDRAIHPGCWVSSGGQAVNSENLFFNTSYF